MKLPHALKNLPPRRERYFSFSVQPFQIESQENLSYIRIIFGISRKNDCGKAKISQKIIIYLNMIMFMLFEKRLSYKQRSDQPYFVLFAVPSYLSCIFQSQTRFIKYEYSTA